MVDQISGFDALVSSDWNECLAPCGPFDPIAFNYPELRSDLTRVFKQYTGNAICLGAAVGEIKKLLPGPLTRAQMDAYLDKNFGTYRGVADLMQWCTSNNILFMINTTGLIGYFQRVFARDLLPRVAVLSANPLIRYPAGPSDPQQILDLFETRDKAQNTRRVARALGIPCERIILMGDSGGDGPHFEWGASCGARLVGSMTKASLERYCRKKNITIDLHFGLSYAEDQKRDSQKEQQVDFSKLSVVIAKWFEK